jgi:hypothetical protein
LKKPQHRQSFNDFGNDLSKIKDKKKNLQIGNVQTLGWQDKGKR